VIARDVEKMRDIPWEVFMGKSGSEDCFYGDRKTKTVLVS
jgi:hypothetical protein